MILDNPKVNTAKDKKIRKKPSKEAVIFHTINYTLLALLSIVMIYPMLNTLAISLNEGLDAVRGGITIWPRAFTFENFIAVFQVHTIPPAFMMSVYRTVVQVVTNLIVTSMLAYTLSRNDYMLRRPISLIFVLTMYFNAGLIPHFILIQNLGMVNTFAVYWVPNMISAFNLLILRTTMKALPESLIESAKIDGAREFRIYAQIIMPLCKPTLATIALFVAVGAWNSWFDAFIFNSGAQNLSVLQFELQRFLSAAMGIGQGGQGGAAGADLGMAMVTPQSIRAAVTIVAAVPVLAVFPFLQKYFVTGVTLGGVKE